MTSKLKSTRLAGEVAVVTGAASGLDRGIALELAMNGATVACADLNDVENEKTVQLIKEVGGEAFAVHMNIGETESVKTAFKEIYDRTKKVSILINGAAVSRFTQMPECTDEEWNFVINVNLTGVFRTMREAYPYMKESGGGSIVNISSTSGKSGGSWSGAHYVAAKAGVIGLARYGAGMFCKDNIRCNAICPGVADTPLTSDANKDQTAAMLKKIPMGRMCTPEDVAGAVMFLVSDESKYVTGISIDVTGGRYIYNN
ncbi:SDR family NAD(P)-dependent oxidoreductase [Anaerobium acetethylicum]|uniref:3-oxoacyl-[acyl-carrier protein] reductase n=1 Tax=Anaerobium acetethylicum TaxID=1619234 RepID=A0A1D3TW32_9FIRM|nr:SDR family NAD(P)-dependent oxidoreductase [Anaerobium acetethylicum]SCP98394.1 3-oxoacyl-[acyl-carrier protein] reductase [Anaerobium acetethylicum]